MCSGVPVPDVAVLDWAGERRDSQSVSASDDDDEVSGDEAAEAAEPDEPTEPADSRGRWTTVMAPKAGEASASEAPPRAESLPCLCMCVWSAHGKARFAWLPRRVPAVAAAAAVFACEAHIRAFEC